MLVFVSLSFEEMICIRCRQFEVVRFKRRLFDGGGKAANLGEKGGRELWKLSNFQETRLITANQKPNQVVCALAYK